MVNFSAIRHARKEVVDIRHLYTQQCHTQKNKSKNKRRKNLDRKSSVTCQGVRPKSRWNLVCIILWMEQTEEAKRRETGGQKIEKNYKRCQTKLQKDAWNRQTTTKKKGKIKTISVTRQLQKWKMGRVFWDSVTARRRNMKTTRTTTEIKEPYVSSSNKIKKWNKFMGERERKKRKWTMSVNQLDAWFQTTR